MDNIFLPPACFPGGIKSKFMKTDIGGMNQALFSSLALRENIEKGNVREWKIFYIGIIKACNDFF